MRQQHQARGAEGATAQRQSREGRPTDLLLLQSMGASHGPALTRCGAPAEQVRGATGAAAQWGAGKPGADGGSAAAGAAHADARARPPCRLLLRRGRLFQQCPLRACAGAAAAAAAQDPGPPLPGVLPWSGPALLPALCAAAGAAAMVPTRNAGSPLSGLSVQNHPCLLCAPSHVRQLLQLQGQDMEHLVVPDEPGCCRQIPS